MDDGVFHGSQNWIGRAMPRREDAALVSGAGRFVDDIAPEGCLVLEFHRSPVACGRFEAVDLDAARAVPGVVGAFAARDLGPLGQAGVNRLLPDGPVRPLAVLADGVVAALGQPVAAVVATSRAAARDGADAVVVDIADVDDGAQTVRAHHWVSGVVPDGAGLVAVEATVAHARLAPMALEPRAALAQPAGAGLLLHLSTQTPFRARDDIARILGLAVEDVAVVAPDVGGAFGGKASIMPEDVMVAFAARALARPVKWTATRSDDFLAATQGRGAITAGRLTLNADGIVLALSAQLDFSLGHWTPYSAFVPGRNAGRILPGPYTVDALDVTLDLHVEARPAVNIYRGAGRPEATMLMERLVDKSARRLGIDPLELRRRNVRRRECLPGPNASGEWLDTGDYPALLDRLATETRYDALRVEQAGRRAAGEVVGLGLALYVEPCGQGFETARVRLADDGRFVADTGSTAQGQGRETATSQIVAHVLGVSPDRIVTREGDSRRLPDGIGALASRSTAIGGSAMLEAAQSLAARMVAALAAAEGVPQDRIRLTPTGLAVDNALVEWADLARRLADEGRVGDARFVAEREAWGSGAALAEMSIDPDTGQPIVERLTWVDDAGTIVNPRLVAGQLWGGLAQGLGHALSERLVYSEDGQLLTGSLLDYAVPRAHDMPGEVRFITQPTPSAANPLGAKGVGEAGTIAVPTAVLNALQDAIAPLTDTDLPLPVTAETLWRAMRKLEVRP